jgi:hypothetical protein
MNPVHILTSYFFNVHIRLYEGLTKSFQTESITKYTLTTINTRWEVTQERVAAKLARLTHRIAIQLHLVAEGCTICSSLSRRPVRKLLDIPSYSHLRQRLRSCLFLLGFSIKILWPSRVLYILPVSYLLTYRTRLY